LVGAVGIETTNPWHFKDSRSRARYEKEGLGSPWNTCCRRNAALFSMMLRTTLRFASLTDVGNAFMIRHIEVGKMPRSDSDMSTVFFTECIASFAFSLSVPGDFDSAANRKGFKQMRISPLCRFYRKRNERRAMLTMRLGTPRSRVE
jgi:hypothetical protein